MATAINLNIIQGSDFNVQIVAADDLGNVYDLTDFTIGGYAKHRYGDSANIFDFKPVIVDPKAGKINLTLSPAETAKIPAGQHLYGIEGVSGDGSSIAFKIMNGYANVLPEVNS